MKKPLNILVGGDYPVNPNSGAAGTVFQTNRALCELGHRVSEIWADDLTHRIKHWNLHYLLELDGAFRSVIKERCRTKSFQVIELNQPHVPNVAEYCRKKLHQTIFINRSHGHEVRVRETLSRYGVRPSNGSILRKLCQDFVYAGIKSQWSRTVRHSDGFHVSSTDDAEFLESRYGVQRDRICIAPQGVSSELLLPDCRKLCNGRKNHFIYIGQFAPVKAPDVLASVFNTILSDSTSFTATWITQVSYHSEIIKMLSDDARNRCTLVGWQDQSRLIDSLDSAGIFVFPSYLEGFGKAPLEAMARGLCVVASRTGGMRDFISHGKNGVLCDIGDSGSFIQEIRKLLNDPQKMEKMSEAARGTAKEYTWKRCAETLTDFYHEMLDRKLNQTDNAR
jgi:glycosyltransferase involved in cell wall biosynthesis